MLGVCVIVCNISDMHRQTLSKLSSLVPWGKDELIRYWGQKVKGQGCGVEAYTARRYAWSSKHLV